MSNSGANNPLLCHNGCGYEACFGKGFARSFPLAPFVCSFYPEGLLEVCLCVFEVLGCVFFLLFCSTCLWLTLSKQSSASGELVALSFSRCLVCGLVSVLMFPVINTIFPFVSLCVSTSAEDDHYCRSLRCGCCHPPHHHPHPDTIARPLSCYHHFIHHPLHPVLHQLACQRKTDHSIWI